jgi:hypothetical protein
LHAVALQNYWTYEERVEYQYFDKSISMVDGSAQNNTVIPVTRPLWVSANRFTSPVNTTSRCKRIGIHRTLACAATYSVTVCGIRDVSLQTMGNVFLSAAEDVLYWSPTWRAGLDT